MLECLHTDKATGDTCGFYDGGDIAQIVFVAPALIVLE
jgi:hypothetical protein